MMYGWTELLQRSLDLPTGEAVGSTPAVAQRPAMAAHRRDSYGPDRAKPNNPRGRGVNYADNAEDYGQPQNLPERDPITLNAQRPGRDVGALYLPGKVPPTGWNGEVDAAAPIIPNR